MSTTILHGQMSAVDKNGDAQVLHQETSAIDVLVNKNTNTQGADGSSVIPSDVDTVQKLTDKLGGLAFRSSISMDDLPDGNYVIVDETTEDIEPPESEINDDVISSSLTWSSNKLNNQFNEISERIDEVNDAANSVFYIPLIENADESYTAQKTVAEIEAAYQNGKAVWVVASDILIPLRVRMDSSTWVFSGYTDTQAYDITITATDVSFSYTNLVTVNDTLPNPSVLKLTGAVNAVYDGSEEVVVEVPVSDSAAIIDDDATSADKVWSSKKVSEQITDLNDRIGGVGSSLVLGETSSTAYRGDRGKTAYDHSQVKSGNPHGVTKNDIGLGNVENKSTSDILAGLTKDNVTKALGYTPPETDTTYPNASTSVYGITKLSSSTNDNSTTTAATPSAVKSAYDLASTAKSTADSANTTATSAQSVANQAKTTAESASVTASAAQNTANTAKTTAESAQSVANEAKTKADTASTTATSAQGVANTAKTTAESAQSVANAALPKSGGTMTGPITAQNNSNYTDKQVRNIFIIADGDDLPSGSNGDICLIYAP